MIEFYQKIIENKSNFPQLSNKKSNKKEIVDHLNINLNDFSDDFDDILQFFQKQW